MMGLDMYFEKTRWATTNVGHIRKGYAIHDWILTNCGHLPGDDDGCVYIRMSESRIKELFKIANMVLEDRKLAPKLLPIHTGEYGEMYSKHLLEILSILSEILSTDDGAEFYYSANW